MKDTVKIVEAFFETKPVQGAWLHPSQFASWWGAYFTLHPEEEDDVPPDATMDPAEALRRVRWAEALMAAAAGNMLPWASWAAWPSHVPYQFEGVMEVYPTFDDFLKALGGEGAPSQSLDFWRENRLEIRKKKLAESIGVRQYDIAGPWGGLDNAPEAFWEWVGKMSPEVRDLLWSDHWGYVKKNLGFIAQKWESPQKLWEDFKKMGAILEAEVGSFPDDQVFWELLGDPAPRKPGFFRGAKYDGREWALKWAQSLKAS